MPPPNATRNTHKTTEAYKQVWGQNSPHQNFAPQHEAPRTVVQCRFSLSFSVLRSDMTFHTVSSVLLAVTTRFLRRISVTVMLRWPLCHAKDYDTKAIDFCTALAYIGDIITLAVTLGTQFVKLDAASRTSTGVLLYNRLIEL